MGVPMHKQMKPDMQKAQPYDTDIKEYNRELQNKMEAYIRQGHSQESTAKLVCVSAGALSRWRQSNYSGSIENVERKIEYFFEHLEEEKQIEKRAAEYLSKLNYVDTSISEDIYKSIKYCQINKGIVIIYGDAGIGKTKAAERYVKENKDVTLYLQATPTTGIHGNFLKVLARALRIPEDYPKYELVQQIRRRLAGTNMVLIIDEAQHLQRRTLEELRTMSDSDGINDVKGIGMVLMGNLEVYDQMMGTQEARFAQVFSRIGLRREYSTRDVLLKDIKKLFPRLEEQGMKRELDFLLSVSQSKWGIRGAVNLYENAAKNEDVNYKGLVGMAHAMGIGLL